jgi:hypothetical protein
MSEQQPTLYPVQVTEVTVTCYVDHPAIGGPAPASYEVIAAEYLEAIVTAITGVSERRQDTLVVLS